MEDGQTRTKGQDIFLSMFVFGHVARRCTSPAVLGSQVRDRGSKDLGRFPRRHRTSRSASITNEMPISIAALRPSCSYRAKQDNAKVQEVLRLFLQKLNFKGASLDEALRSMVVRFRLPGEAQQMDRFALLSNIS